MAWERRWYDWTVTTVPGDQRKVQSPRLVSAAMARQAWQPRPGCIGLYNGIGIRTARPLGRGVWVQIHPAPQKGEAPRRSVPDRGRGFVA